MDAPKNNLWFKAKLYGWGWYPATWEGWLVMAVYVAVIVLDLYRLDATGRFKDGAPYIVSIPFLVATAVLIAICYRKGEKPRWRWGKE